MQLSILFHSGNIGFMILFLAVIAPSVFKTLSQKAAATYLRTLFPRMFTYGLILSIAATIAATFEDDNQAILISLIISVGFALNAFVLTPIINSYRDSMLQGDKKASRRFSLLHMASVAIFLSQLLGSSFLILAKSV